MSLNAIHGNSAVETICKILSILKIDFPRKNFCGDVYVIWDFCPTDTTRVGYYTVAIFKCTLLLSSSSSLSIHYITSSYYNIVRFDIVSVNIYGTQKEITFPHNL